MAGADFCTLSALDTFFVVDHREIIYHGDRTRRAGLRAFAAGNTAEFANV